MSRMIMLALSVFLLNMVFFGLNSMKNDDGSKLFYGIESYAFLKTHNMTDLNDTIYALSPKQSTEGPEEGVSIPILSDLWNAGQFIATSFKVLANTFIYPSLAFPFMLGQPPFNLPDWLVLIFSTGFILVYILGLIAFIRGYQV